MVSRKYLLLSIWMVFSLISGMVSGVSADNSDARLREMASERWHAWRKAQTSFPLAAWSYFHRYPGTKDEFDLYKNAGLTYVMPGPGQDANAAAAGLDIAAGAFQPLHENKALLESTATSAIPADHHVIAYILKDEPLVQDYPALGKAVAYLYENDVRGAIPIMDFRPNWAVPYKRWNMTYETYFERFLDEVHPCVLLNCHYPVMRDGGTRPMYYANIEYFRKKALDYDIGLMGFVMITAHSFPGNAQIDYREPSESDIRWMAYTYLAYGAQGLWYYNWRISDERFRTAIVDSAAGRPTRYFPIVAGLNREIAAIGPILMHLRSTGVYHTGASIPEGTTRLYEGFVKGLGEWQGDDCIIGVFENRDDTADTSVYLMIVNKRHEADTGPSDLTSSISFSVNPDYSRITCLSPADDSLWKFTSGKGICSLDLGGGQGVLVRLER